MTEKNNQKLSMKEKHYFKVNKSSKIKILKAFENKEG